MRRALFLLPVALFVAIAVYFLLALNPNRDPTLVPSALIDKPAPQFQLGGLEGGAGLASTGLKGQVAIVNFFASWCEPCRDEHALLMGLEKQAGVPVYGIAYKDKQPDTERFLKQLGDPYHAIGVDENGRTAIDFGVYGVPETYVIDKDGRIRKRFVGPLNERQVTRELLPLVQQLQHS
ncbi:MAG TPA: DsbE family thiol:disulfide interchange protein [Stellaceae bacterium]|nr:DsbE family thiol:disulfide interchange protein [Stellaceae bacterium]